jgi:hypothetical protein
VIGLSFASSPSQRAGNKRCLELLAVAKRMGTRVKASVLRQTEPPFLSTEKPSPRSRRQETEMDAPPWPCLSPDPKNRAATSENTSQVTISKELRKLTFSIMAHCVNANIPFFLTTGSLPPPAASRLHF